MRRLVMVASLAFAAVDAHAAAMMCGGVGADARRSLEATQGANLALDATRIRRGFRFINHSCEPNTFMRCTPTRAEFYARRDIAAGEELTVDYMESHHDGKLACRCGAARCRGFI